MTGISTVLAATVLAAACGGGISDREAEARLRRAVLTAADVGGGYTQAIARTRTNDEAARARPDSDQARAQYDTWGQVLAYDVEFDPPAGSALSFSPQAARVLNSATLYRSAKGAGAALAYTRGLPSSLVADVLVNEGAGTKITDTQVTPLAGVPPAGDESFAWRVSGKATFEDGLTMTFIADSVYIRQGAVTGNVTSVALGQTPDRASLLGWVRMFVERAKESG